MKLLPATFLQSKHGTVLVDVVEVVVVVVVVEVVVVVDPGLVVVVVLDVDENAGSHTDVLERRPPMVVFSTSASVVPASMRKDCPPVGPVKYV
jgi:hypothetical protein